MVSLGDAGVASLGHVVRALNLEAGCGSAPALAPRGSVAEHPTSSGPFSHSQICAVEAHCGVTGVSLMGKNVEPHLFHVSPSCIPLGGWRPKLLSILWLEFGAYVS